MKNSEAFFENGSWYHRTKILNDDYTVKYSKKGGFKTEEEAKESYMKYDKDFKDKIAGTLHTFGNDLTFKDFLIYWFDNIFSQRIESTTKMISSYTLYSLILPNIVQDIKLKFVTTEFLNELFKKIETVSSSPSVRKAQELIRIALNDALAEKKIITNPMNEINLKKRERKKIIILNKNQIKQFLSYVANDNWYLEILLALFCGLRKGEIEGLKFSDFDMNEKTVKISRQIVANYLMEDNKEVRTFKIKEYQLTERDPKTVNSYRKLRVPDIIIEQLINRKNLIEYYKKRFKDYEDNDYISCQTNGKPHSLSAFNGYLRRVCKKLALPQITVHGLRHMYATILIENGVELVQISGLLGHDSINTTFEYYCDVMEEDRNINNYINNSFAVNC